MIWVLYAMGIATLLTPFVGMAMVRTWQHGERAPLWKAHFKAQSMSFVLTGLVWALAICMFFAGAYTDMSAGRAATASPSDQSILFAVGLIMALTAQVIFTIYSVFGLSRAVQEQPLRSAKQKSDKVSRLKKQAPDVDIIA